MTDVGEAYSSIMYSVSINNHKEEVVISWSCLRAVEVAVKLTKRGKC